MQKVNIKDTWLRAMSRSSPLPLLADADFESSLKEVVQELICSTEFNAEEYIHASIKKGGRVDWRD